VFIIPIAGGEKNLIMIFTASSKWTPAEQLKANYFMRTREQTEIEHARAFEITFLIVN